MNNPEFLQKVLHAYGGEEKLKSFRDLQATFDFSFFQPDGAEMPGKGEEKFKSPNKSYFKFEFPNLVMVNACDGEKGWQTENGGEAKAIDSDRFILNSRLRQFPLFLTDNAVNWNYKGMVDLDNFNQVHWVQVIYSEKEKVSFYLDPLTFWLCRYQGPSKVMGRNITTVVHFEEYEKTSGFVFPKKQIFLINVNKFQERTYSHFQINTALSDCVFLPTV